MEIILSNPSDYICSSRTWGAQRLREIMMYIGLHIINPLNYESLGRLQAGNLSPEFMPRKVKSVLTILILANYVFFWLG